MSSFALTQGSNRLLARLSQTAWGEVSGHLRPVKYAQSQVLWEPGEAVDGIFFPYDGGISIVTELLDGHALETAIIGPEGAVGAVESRGSGISFGRAVCQLPAHGMFLSAAVLRAHISVWPELTESLNRWAESLMAYAQQSGACHAQHSAQSRLCRWLLTAQDRTGESDLPLTQQFISDMLGVQRTTVTGSASQLQASGWIAYRRGHVRILDRDAMLKCACECYHALRHHEAQVWAEPETQIFQHPRETM